MMLLSEHLLKEAAAIETLARMISYQPDKATLLRTAEELRREAARAQLRDPRSWEAGL